MEDIKNVMIKKDTCVVALMMFYDTKTNKPIKVYNVLISVIYCHSKTLSSIYYDKIIEQASYNG